MIATIARNPFIYAAVEKARLTLSDVLIALPESGTWLGRSDDEHVAIFDAIEEQDETRAESTMGTHVLHTQHAVEVLLRAVSQSRTTAMRS